MITSDYICLDIVSPHCQSQPLHNVWRTVIFLVIWFLMKNSYCKLCIGNIDISLTALEIMHYIFLYFIQSTVRHFLTYTYWLNAVMSLLMVFLPVILQCTSRKYIRICTVSCLYKWFTFIHFTFSGLFVYLSSKNG